MERTESLSNGTERGSMVVTNLIALDFVRSSTSDELTYIIKERKMQGVSIDNDRNLVFSSEHLLELFCSGFGSVTARSIKGEEIGNIPGLIREFVCVLLNKISLEKKHVLGVILTKTEFFPVIKEELARYEKIVIWEI